MTALYTDPFAAHAGYGRSPGLVLALTCKAESHHSPFAHIPARSRCKVVVVVVGLVAGGGGRGRVAVVAVVVLSARASTCRCRVFNSLTLAPPPFLLVLVTYDSS